MERFKKIAHVINHFRVGEGMGARGGLINLKCIYDFCLQKVRRERWTPLPEGRRPASPLYTAGTPQQAYVRASASDSHRLRRKRKWMTERRRLRPVAPEACHVRRRIHVYGGMPYEEEDTCMYVRLVYGGMLCIWRHAI